MDDAVPGSGDCAVRLNDWGQPALLASSASYVIAALFVVWWARRHHNAMGSPVSAHMWVYALALVAAGLTSMDYHGPARGPQPLLHDAGVAVALLSALAIDLNILGATRLTRTWAWAGLTAATVVLLAGTPEIGPPLLGAVAVSLIFAEIGVYRRGLRRITPALWAGLVAVTLGGVVFTLSRTGGPLCDPQSWLQGHGLWHALTAVTFGLWAVTVLPDREPHPSRWGSAVREKATQKRL